MTEKYDNEADINICKNMVNHLLSELHEEKRINKILINKMNFILDNNEKSLEMLNNCWSKDYETLQEYCHTLETRLKIDYN
jgi:hypothetical protein